MNLNFKQVLAIIGAILGVLIVSNSQLTDLVGADLTKKLVSLAAILNTMLNASLAVIVGQSGTVKDVLAMPGIERITVNEQASQTLAQIATDPSQGKISATPASADRVEQTAKE